MCWQCWPSLTASSLPWPQPPSVCHWYLLIGRFLFLLSLIISIAGNFFLFFSAQTEVEVSESCFHDQIQMLTFYCYCYFCWQTEDIENPDLGSSPPILLVPDDGHIDHDDHNDHDDYDNHDDHDDYDNHHPGVGASSPISLVPSHHPDLTQWIHLVHRLSYHWKVQQCITSLWYLYHLIWPSLSNNCYGQKSIYSIIFLGPVKFSFNLYSPIFFQFFSNNFSSKVHFCGPPSTLVALILQHHLHCSRHFSLHSLECAQAIQKWKYLNLPIDIPIHFDIFVQVTLWMVYL